MKDFGARPYFEIDRHWYSYLRGEYEPDVWAFLILPIETPAMLCRPDKHVVAYFVYYDLDPTILAGMTDSLREGFQRAANVLQLNQPKSKALKPQLMIIGCDQVEAKGCGKCESDRSGSFHMGWLRLNGHSWFDIFSRL